MKNIILLISVIVIFGNTGSYAQTDQSRITDFPRWHNLRYEKTNDIPRFFSEWEEWSKLIAKGAQGIQYNDIFAKFFLKYHSERDTVSGNPDTCKYIAIPYTVKVVKFNCEIHPDKLSARFPEVHDCIYTLSKEVLPESISYFTPRIEIEKPVLYLIPEAEKLLATFLDAPKESKEVHEITDEEREEREKRRRSMINEYVPALSAHWGDRWFFSSYPLFGTIYVGQDGYYVNISNANYSGFEIFVTWSGEETMVKDWIQ